MKFKRWLILLVVYIVFMMAGAAMFLYLERWFESEEREALDALKIYIQGVVWSLENSTRGDVVDMLGRVGDECGHDFLVLGEEAPPTWTLWNSFFFTFTVITTIGFGHMAPKTPWGRIACILYAFIGVPLNGILIASLADIFSSKVMRWDVRRWAARYKSWFTVLVDGVVFLIPGLIVFLIIPSIVVMSVEEDWSYLDSFYFSFITLTTIGFGDHVAGQQERDHVWVWVYKIAMVVWIIFGLGYIIMIITFVQKVLKSKKILNVEKKLAGALKKHVARVHLDLGNVRKAINTSPRIRPDDGKEVQIDPASPEQHSKFDLPLPPLPPHTTGYKRQRSASESDISTPHVMYREEVEGMNAMLDFIERLLHQQETRALTTFTRLLHQFHSAGDEDEEDGKTERPPSLDVETGYDNAVFESEEGDVTGRPETTNQNRRRKRSYAQELLYFMLVKRRLDTTTTTTPPPTYDSLCNSKPTPEFDLLTQYLQTQNRAHPPIRPEGNTRPTYLSLPVLQKDREFTKL